VPVSAVFDDGDAEVLQSIVARSIEKRAAGA
jgi:hypothetical protein